MTNAPVVFMYLMNGVFRPYFYKFVVVCVDDILIFSKTVGECREHLRVALQILKDHQLYSNLSKCDFWLNKMQFLGHIVSDVGISVDPEKVVAVTNWKQLKTVSDVWSFLRLAGYYRQFIQDFSKRAVSMTHLTRKEVPFVWKAKCESAFHELKKRLMSAPVLIIP